MAGTSTTPRLDQLLGRLVLLAGDVRDLLASANLDGAAPAQDEFDIAFAQLQRLVETGHTFEPRHEHLLAQLRDVHHENERLTRQVRDAIRRDIRSVDTTARVNLAYAPLGTTVDATIRRIDGAA